MTKKILAIFLVSLFALRLATPVKSQEQEFDFQKAYDDYIFTTSTYQKAHADYLLARSQYLQAKTLTAQTNARDKTVSMLETRDDVLRAYLTTLRMKLNAAKGVQEISKEGLFSRIDTDVAWYLDHKNRINSAGTLEDLVDDSDEAANHYPFTESLAYEALSVIAQGVTVDLRDRVGSTLNGLKSKNSEIKTNGDLDTSVIDRWVIETEQKLTRSIEKNTDALSLIAGIQDPKTKNKSRVYDEVLFRLQESLQFVKEANTFVAEIIRNIRFVN